MSKQPSGISLLELLIVVSILGTVAFVVAPDISRTDQTGLDLATAEIAHAMRFARSEASRTGNPHGFRQESNIRRIRVFRLDTSSSPAVLIYDVYHPITKKLYDVTLDTLPYVHIDTVTRSTTYRGTCNKTGNVYFDDQGTPWCADPTNILLQQMDIVLTLDAQSATVSLDGITGRVGTQ